MKILLFMLLTTATARLTAYPQTTGPVADRFRVLIATPPTGWNYVNNYSTINNSRMKKTIFMSTLVAITMSANAQPANNDEEAIRTIVTTMQNGWNEKNGKIFASSFANPHNYIVVNGMYLSSITPEMNANSHQGIFNSIYKTTDLALKPDKITFVRPDLALVYVLGATYEQGTAIPENPGVVISMMAEKKGNDWKIISFHNCDIEVSFDPANAAPTPLSPKTMFASWYKK